MYISHLVDLISCFLQGADGQGCQSAQVSELAEGEQDHASSEPDTADPADGET